MRLTALPQYTCSKERDKGMGGKGKKAEKKSWSEMEGEARGR